MTCPVTVHPNDLAPSGHRMPSHPCGLPLAPGARFCAKHEADRLRLGGQTFAKREQAQWHLRRSEECRAAL